MYDFYLKDGDLVFDRGNLATCDSDLLSKQMALCRIKSIKKDWFGDHIGCDIEKRFGGFYTEELVKMIEGDIRIGLTCDGLFDADNIYITSTYTENTRILSQRVYIKSAKDPSKAFCILVVLDIVKGEIITKGE